MEEFPDTCHSRRIASYSEQAVSPYPREGTAVHLQGAVDCHPRDTGPLRLQMTVVLRPKEFQFALLCVRNVRGVRHNPPSRDNPGYQAAYCAAYCWQVLQVPRRVSSPNARKHGARRTGAVVMLDTGRGRLRKTVRDSPSSSLSRC